MCRDPASSRPSAAGPATPASSRHVPRVGVGVGASAGGVGGELLATERSHVPPLLPPMTSPGFEPSCDGAFVEAGSERLLLRTRSFVVTPIFFPGGDIGELAVNSTINALAAAGARPVALSFASIVEEGLPASDLVRVLESLHRAAERAGVPIVASETTSVGRGHGDGLFVNASGVGLVPRGLDLGAARVCAGDAVLVSGAVGEHGISVLLHREGLSIAGELRSDTAPLHGLVQTLLERCPDVHAMRCAARGGLARALGELASRRSLGIVVDEAAVPMHEDVRATCDLLGLDPWTVPNEGKLVVFVPERSASAALSAMRSHPLGRKAARVGVVTSAHPGAVVARSARGSERVVSVPPDDPLPRTC